MKIIQENLKLIITAIIVLIIVIVTSIVLSLKFGGETMRNLTVNDINGGVVIIRDSKQFYVNKKTIIKSGDIINTDEESNIKICIDPDKYVIIEPQSTVYIYYTDISDKGEVSVNIANGAVITQLNEPLKSNETFQVKTPNTAVSVRGTVFRTEFTMEEKYMGYDDVMITHVENFQGSVMLQLYNQNSEKVDEPMLLTERTSAELVSGIEFAQYGYLNYDIDMYAQDDFVLKELIRISGQRTLAYTIDELNSSLQAVRKRMSTQTEPVETEVTEETTVTTTAPPVETETTPITTTPIETESPQESTTNTLATTLQTHIYTTYAGPKWWEMPNENPNINENEFDDGGVFNTEVVTVTP